MGIPIPTAALQCKLNPVSFQMLANVECGSPDPFYWVAGSETRPFLVAGPETRPLWMAELPVVVVEAHPFGWRGQRRYVVYIRVALLESGYE